MNPIELGKFIATLRNEKNLTQEELAEKLYIDKRKVSRWECGTSTPEFDMLIKLSEILDVSLYELSIAKRIENEKITRRIINKFKSVKDFNQYKMKKKIIIIIQIIFFILFIITATFTIEHNDTVEIYRINSLDDKYYLKGNYIRAKNFTFFYIKEVGLISETKEKNAQLFENCDYEVIDNDIRLIYDMNNVKQGKSINEYNYFYESNHERTLNNIVKVQIKCTNKKTDKYIFDIELTKIYDNKLF